MTKVISTGLILTLFLSCGESTTTTHENNTAENSIADSLSSGLLDTDLLPADRMISDAELILGEAQGDLNKDGVEEKVVVYTTDDEGDFGKVRHLVVYKQENGKWVEWVLSDKAVLGSEGGGMMGDPFTSVTIEKGIIHIEHFGGSSWKWTEVDKYRFQEGDFYLIGHSSNYGKPCEYWDFYDYNLSTGDCVFEHEKDDCGDGFADEYEDDFEEKFNHKMKTLPKMTSRVFGEYEIKTPKGNTVFL
jgi:hypothetical protein